MYLRRCTVSNWGDSLNIVLTELISGEKPYGVGQGFKPPNNDPVFLVIGSILQWAGSNDIVWGTGFISEASRVKSKPAKVCAVRGPLSYQKLIGQGVDCPKIFGDPALLYPKFYKPAKIKKKYKLGIIPHYVDKRISTIDLFRNKSDILIINIQGPINQVVDDICSCEQVASSCLHGIICADAYGVPSIWIKFSDKVMGQGFKFRDYFMSVNRKDREPLVMNNSVSIKTILDRFDKYSIDIDLDVLYNVCPFKK